MHCLSFFLCEWIETTSAFFHSIGNFIWLKHDLKIFEKGLHKEGPHSFNIWILIISWPWAFWESRLFIVFIMFSFDNWTLLRRFSVRNFLVARYYFLAVNIALQKNVLKSSAFSLKSITNLLLWNTGGMHGIFLSFKNIFNIDQ